MNEITLGILQQVRNFYTLVAGSFSRTRSNPWKGWIKVIEILKIELSQKKHISVLDLGCGNGRFYNYLVKNMEGNNFKYLGYDNNNELLNEAKSKFTKKIFTKHKNANFKYFDIFLNAHKIKWKYDLVVGFGITHHIPTKKFRKAWFNTISKKVKCGGLLIFTFWNLQEDYRFENAVKADELEEGDYYYGWGDTEAKRFVHIYNENEYNEIIKNMEKRKLALIDSYYNDGKSGKLNRYLIFMKTN